MAGTAIPAPTLAYQFAGHVPDYAIPKTPVPEGLSAPTVAGDAARGQKTYSSSACIGCHAIAGNPMSVGNVGPNLTHVGSRLTIGAGLYPNDAKHLALWIKNARMMKPGSQMPTLGKNQKDPITGQVVTVGGLDDQQIADIVAYLQALK
ncbi:MAG TPA: c-type cytochrome [Gemmatimonadaceae bacterium]|nr:c-type cytochrome [Gemmatimonadaceae bacterium]